MIKTGVVFGHERLLSLPRNLTASREGKLGNILQTLGQSFSSFEQGVFHETIPLSLRTLQHLHKKVIFAARLVDLNDPEHHYGYKDLYNLFKPALCTAMYIEKEFFGQREAERKVADIIFIAARLGSFYYYERGKGGTNETPIEYTLIMTQSALLRYRQYGTQNKQRQVEAFIKKCLELGGFPVDKPVDEILSDFMSFQLSNWINTLKESPNMHYVMQFGLKGFLSDGNYPFLAKTYGNLAQELEQIGMTEEAAGWKTLANECRDMAERLFGLTRLKT